ncbi:MAG: carboxypeptidase-like regulatory domain-containing protein, partial [Salinivirgaceae bacterium]|nr:carboxypeptidase-like regulatory domain-containing protein [Salinivirgaceae bacterium]
MKKLTFLATLIVAMTTFAQAQTTQTIRGQVSDVASGEPMTGATIMVDGQTDMAAVSDADGRFAIQKVPVGRHTVRVSFVGYEPLELKEQLLSSGKEMVLDLKMTESISTLDEVVVKPQVNKQLPLNEMAQVVARMFSVEEASRYAGGVSDPARTASMFPGVAGSG